MFIRINHGLIVAVSVAETAENIGYSCNLLREEMNDVFIVSGHSLDDVRQELRSGGRPRVNCLGFRTSASLNTFSLGAETRGAA